MGKKFDPEKYGMMACPLCKGSGHIHYPCDLRVCQNCGGFGFIKKEQETFDLKDKPISTTVFKR